MELAVHLNVSDSAISIEHDCSRRHRRHLSSMEVFVTVRLGGDDSKAEVTDALESISEGSYLGGLGVVHVATPTSREIRAEAPPSPSSPPPTPSFPQPSAPPPAPRPPTMPPPLQPPSSPASPLAGSMAARPASPPPHAPSPSTPALAVLGDISNAINTDDRSTDATNILVVFLAAGTGCCGVLAVMLAVVHRRWSARARVALRKSVESGRLSVETTPASPVLMRTSSDVESVLD